MDNRMTLHEEVLYIIEEQDDASSFREAVDRLKEAYGEEAYAELIHVLASISMEPPEAMAMWEASWRHMEALSSRLGRPVNISVALLDYILCEKEGYIRGAKVIDVRNYERVAQSAIRDGLTGLYNPGYIREQVAWELVKDRRYRKGGTVILFDLNQFKECNDAYGHLAGDAVLRSFATCLKEHTRRSDAAGRYGGDEFLVLMPATPMEGAFIVAERIRRAFEETVVHVPTAPPEGIRTTTTGGIAEYIGGNRQDMEELIEAADQALYLGKREGANRVYTEWIVGDNPVPVDSYLIKPVSAVECTEDVHPKTIGNRPFTVETSERTAQGPLVVCELRFPAADESFICHGRIIRATALQHKKWAVVFQAVEQAPADWLPINRFIMQYERVRTEERARTLRQPARRAALRPEH